MCWVEKTPDNFGCSNFTLNEPLPIEDGDALGVCVFDPPGNDIHSLNLIGEPGAVNSSDLWRLREGSFSSGTSRAPDSCSETSVPGTVTGSDARSTRAVYLHANIGTVITQIIVDFLQQLYFTEPIPPTTPPATTRTPTTSAAPNESISTCTTAWRICLHWRFNNADSYR